MCCPTSLEDGCFSWACWVSVRCAALRIKIEPREADNAPEVARHSDRRAGTYHVFGILCQDRATFSPSPFWLRPLDLFEMIAVVLLGISLRRLPGSSTQKSIGAAILIAIGWSLTSRGYFHPF